MKKTENRKLTLDVERLRYLHHYGNIEEAVQFGRGGNKDSRGKHKSFVPFAGEHDE
jgi:hypothetical protein